MKHAAPCLQLIGSLSLAMGPALWSADAAPAPLSDAVAVWHFETLDDRAGANSALKAEDAVKVGEPCTAAGKTASLARGGDGFVADCGGGFLVAGQGAGGELNLTGAALSLYARLRNTSGDWTSCGIVSKHGGKERLTYNLYASQGNLGFELGTNRGWFQAATPAQNLGADDWLDVVVRYDGGQLELFVDGVPMAARPASGKLRTGNTEPLVLGGYTIGGQLRGPFKGQLDTVALWSRTLDDSEIVALSGGEEEVKRRREARLAAPYAGLPEPVADYRRVVKSTDLETYSRAARALRKWMIANDPHRPIYHFTGTECWINDPNGPIYHEGKYHLFYQFDPQVPDGRGGWRRSARCWGHAVSDDLVHWVDWPVAVWPDTPYDCGGVYSGNTFSHDGKIHGLYTGNVSGRGGPRYGMLTWSDDGGVTWKKKMVMDHNQRPNDQSPVHHDGYVWKDGETWFQLIGGSTGGRNAQGAAWLWSSGDLERWKLERNIAPSVKRGKFWELPYLIELGGKHVLLAGAGNPYWVGAYDKQTMLFTPDDPKPQSIDNGTYYSFNVNMVDDKGPGGARRQLMHGWVTGPPSPTKTVPWWQGAHSIPRLITCNGKSVAQQPVPEIETLRGEHRNRTNLVIPAGTGGHLPAISGDALELIATFDRAATAATRLGLKVRLSGDGKQAVRVWYEPATDNFGVDGTVTKAASARGGITRDGSPGQPITLRIFLDRSIVEIYTGGAALTARCFPDPAALGVDLFAEGGSAVLTRLDAWTMGSMWE